MLLPIWLLQYCEAMRAGSLFEQRLSKVADIEAFTALEHQDASHASDEMLLTFVAFLDAILIVTTHMRFVNHESACSLCMSLNTCFWIAAIHS